jgi:hypothetical protein
MVKIAATSLFTEHHWLNWAEPNVLLPYVTENSQPRKRRLLLCAFCRQFPEVIADEHLLAPLLTAERYADGRASTAELAAEHPLEGRVDPSWPRGDRKRVAALSVSRAVDKAAWCHSEAVAEIDKKKHCDLIRDIFGNPFRPAAVQAAWLRWNGGTVPGLARSIYEGHRFRDMPILHDALLDAGCDDQDILDHCKAPGPHVRGCWVLDLLLGKE